MLEAVRGWGRVLSGATLVAVAAALALLPATAGATFPGTNGRIAFYTDRFGGQDEIATIKPDGTGFERLTNNPGDDTEPTFSPNGRQILYTHDEAGDIQVWRMRADGANQQQVTSGQADKFAPTWGPKGKTFAYQRGHHIWTANIDGTNPQQVTTGTGINENPDWSPNGNWIAFDHQVLIDPIQGVIDDDIVKIRPNGQDRTDLTPSSRQVDALPGWSPNNARIVFDRFPQGNSSDDDVLSIKSGGGDLQTVVGTPPEEGTANYSPNGQRVAYASKKSGNLDIWTKALATPMQDQLTTDPAHDTWTDWQALGKG
jgi:Tol biopolymer transport system component